MDLMKEVSISSHESKANSNGCLMNSCNSLVRCKVSRQLGQLRPIKSNDRK